MRHTPRGLTLLEVLTVLALVGLFAGMSVSGIRGMVARQRVSDTERQVLMMMQEARQKSRATGQAVRLTRSTELEGGVAVTRLRWEALACSDDWGTQCPMAACQTKECGEGGCVCPERGPGVVVPRQLDVSSVVGLCWMGAPEPGSSAPGVVRATSGRTCDVANPRPVDGQLVLLRDLSPRGAPLWRPDVVLQVDTLSGATRSLDCTRAPTTTGCL
ncbi:prepilin-type N-terminal cleavage/methylation domain-containing protein [Myxococcus sp. K15C18031901]|uniref:pilus assembly FimT family protein n=1 Tax=Myxococcus dinghuensis TaxID=2906761 RepID=UPI0020A80669|nr:prepilin-type N-terminal cleavage/methylation domain-containing protein [Myxococcus dinghuensis]MCP3103092.1 prepilin-type N-terminal cleavage/methylation domain-containing protein [Myxococcus dinghuensis]